MKNRIILSLLLITMLNNSNAQELTNNGTLIDRKYGFSTGYFGYKFNNHGFQIGMEKYVATTNNYNVIGGLNYHYYYQPDIQSAMGISARIGQRYICGFGLFFESYLGIGIQQTFFVNKTFEYYSGVSTITETKRSKTGISPSLSLGLGYDFEKKTKYPIKFYLRQSFYWLYPDRNLVFQSSYAVETGLIYVPTWRRQNK